MIRSAAMRSGGWSVVLVAGVLASQGAAAELKLGSNMQRQLKQWVQFEVVSGKFVPTSKYSGRSMSSSSRSGKHTERLSVSTSGGGVAMEYSLTEALGSLAIKASQDGTLSIRAEPKNPADFTPVQFHQNPAEGLTLTIGAGDLERSYRAGSLWELLLVEPEESQRHLLPWLKQLQEDWDPHATLRGVEGALFALVRSEPADQRAKWQKLVEAMASEEFGDRDVADRRLRQAGPAVLPFLYSLDVDELDAEQRFRIRRIIKSLSGDEGVDSPAEVARALAGEPRVWLSLLESEELERRQLAARQLEELLGREIEFDPAAEPAVRDGQLGALREELRP